MPVYEYECCNCGHKVEVEHSIKDQAQRTCEKCGAPLKRLVARANFVLKGKRWAKDGYGK